MKTTRIEALIDAVFAIVMTILVLDLKVPILSHDLITSASLNSALIDLWPRFLAFTISFIIIATYWNSHHIQSTKIKESNITYVWLTMIFLFFVCLIPFSAAFIGEYPNGQIAQIFYGTNLIICGLGLYAVWSYAIANGRLIEPGSVSRELQFNAKNKVLLPPILYLIGIIVSFFDTEISLIFFALGPLVYFIPVNTRTWEFLTDPLNRHRPHFNNG
jgi:uncharacterized membrane protein